MPRARFEVCFDINYVSPGETFILTNSRRNPVTITNCNPPLIMDSYTIPAGGTAQATVSLDAVPGQSYPYKGCGRGNPQIIVGS